MVTIDLLTTPSMVPRMTTDESWIWGDVRENGKNKLVWEFEDCENGIE